MGYELSTGRIKKLNSSRRREDNRNAAKAGPVTVTRRLPDGTTVTEVQVDPAVEKAQKAVDQSQNALRAQSRPNRSRSRSSSTERKSADPRGTKERSRRVTAALGNKPNRMPWRQFHAIAQNAPWTLTSKLDGPDRKLTQTEFSRLKSAHDQLAEDKLTPDAYLAAVRRIIDPPATATSSSRRPTALNSTEGRELLLEKIGVTGVRPREVLAHTKKVNKA